MSPRPTDAPASVDWIAAELRGASLRAWAMAADRVTDRHVAAVPPGGLPEALDQMTRRWGAGGPIPAIVCGHREATRVPVPVRPADLRTTQHSRTENGGGVHLVPTVVRSDPDAALHGDALRIAGFLSLNRNWDGVICQPGPDETTWTLVSADEIVGFQGSLTPALGRHVAQLVEPGDGDTVAPTEHPALLELLDDVLSRPERLAERLWAAVQSAHRTSADEDAALAMQWGALIGAELAAARPYWLGQQLAVIGKDGLARLYVAGLERQGCTVIQADDEAMTIAGFVSMHGGM